MATVSIEIIEEILELARLHAKSEELRYHRLLAQAEFDLLESPTVDRPSSNY